MTSLSEPDCNATPMPALVSAVCSGGFCLIWPAISSTLPASWSPGTTSVTRPYASASAAWKRRAVYISSAARPAPMMRGSSQETPRSQALTPARRNAVEKTVPSAATRMSQAAA